MVAATARTDVIGPRRAPKMAAYGQPGLAIMVVKPLSFALLSVLAIAHAPPVYR
jgi:hypothetical protein